MQLYYFVHGYPVFLAPFIRKNIVSQFNGLCTLIWKRQWQPTPVLLPGISHGRRCPVGYSPWGREESDMTEQLYFHFSHFTFMNWRRKWQPTPVFLPGKSHGQKSLVDYSPWCCKELDTSEQAYTHCSKQPFWLELHLLAFYLLLTASSQPRV